MKLAIPSRLVQKYIKCGVLPPRPFSWWRGVIHSDCFTYVDSGVAISRLSPILHCFLTAVSTLAITDRARYGHEQGTVRSQTKHGTVKDRCI